MAISYTPRLGLAKPDSDEFQLVGVLNNNEDLLDKAVGGRMVSAGVIPPPTELYDGLIVNERDTGKTWIASSNGAGGFDRAWIRYPWQVFASSPVVTIPPSGAPTTLNNLIFSSGLNADSTSIVAGRIVLPISGVYRVDINANFGSNTNSNQNHRAILMSINSAQNAYFGQFPAIEIANQACQFQYNSVPMVLNAGTTVAPMVYQNSGLPMPSSYAHIFITLISVTGKNNN